MKRRIKVSQRKEHERIRLSALSRGAKFYKPLYNARKKELFAVVDKLELINPNDWVSKAPELIEGKYLSKLISNLYRQVGVPAAREEVNLFLSRKSDIELWDELIEQYIAQNAGAKVKIINESIKAWFREELSLALNNTTVGVEDLTQYMTRVLRGRIENVLEWQVRRIIQTEALTALSVAGDQAIKALNVPFTKTWGISGKNTRDAHLVMEGVTIDSTEMFVVNGELMEYPRDGRTASAGNVINCNCFLIRSPKK